MIANLLRRIADPSDRLDQLRLDAARASRQCFSRSRAARLHKARPVARARVGLTLTPGPVNGERVMASKNPSASAQAPASCELAVLRINVTESYVVAEWSRRLGCTASELRATAALVGNVAAVIEAHLRPVADASKQRAALRAAFEGGSEPPIE